MGGRLATRTVLSDIFIIFISQYFKSFLLESSSYYTVKDKRYYTQLCVAKNVEYV